MRITSKGQVTIPQRIRERMGLLPNTDVEFIVEGNAVRIVRVEVDKDQSRGRRALRSLRGRAKTIAMTTDEIMALTRDEP